MSKEELAKELNVPIQTILDWEERDTKPDIEKILQMCGVLSCTLDELLQGETEIEAVSEDFIKKYERCMKASARESSFAIGLLFFAVATLLILLSLDYSKKTAVSWMVAIVVLAIVTGLKSLFAHNAFIKKYPSLPNFYSKKQFDRATSRVLLLFLAAVGLVGCIVIVFFKSSIFSELHEMGTLFLVGVISIISGIFVMVFIDMISVFAIYDIDAYNKANRQIVLKKKGTSADGYR